MENKEDKAIYQKITQLYNSAKFKSKKDEHAFLKLARTYMGRNSETGKSDENMISLESRKAAGDNIFDSTVKNAEISDEAKARISQLNETYSQHYEGYTQRRNNIKQALKNSKLYETYNTQVADRLAPLALVYAGLDETGNDAFKTVEERYEQADKAAMKLGKMTGAEQKAARDLYNMFKTHDGQDYETNKDTRTRREDARRDALRIQHANTMNHSLEGMVTKDAKVETALERTVPDSRRGTGGVIGYIGNTLKKPWGKVAAAAVAFATMGVLYSQIKGCGKEKYVATGKIEQILTSVPQPDLEKVMEENGLRPENERFTPDPFAPMRDKFTPDPFKPVPEIEKALAGTEEGKAEGKALPGAGIIPEAAKEAGAKEDAKERTRCIDWQKSKLEQGILAYKFEGDTFKARVNKDLAEAMRNDPNVVLRFIADNKLYETNKIGPNGEIEIKGVTYATGAQFGIIKKAEGNCGDYLASLRTGKPAEARAETRQAPITEERKTGLEQKIVTEEKKKHEMQIKKEVTLPEKAPVIKEEKEKVTEYREEKKDYSELEQRIKGLKELEELRQSAYDVLGEITQLSLTYHKMSSLIGGKYDYARQATRTQEQDIYQTLKKALRETDSSYMSIMRTSGTDQKIPKILVEFSNRDNETMLEHRIDVNHDANNLTKRTSKLNIFNDKEPGFAKDEKFSYPRIVMMGGLNDEQKATTALKAVLEEIGNMREQFSTYWFERDVKRADPTAKPPVQAHLLVTGGTKKQSAIVITPRNTDVQLISEKRYATVEDKIDNDNLQIGETPEEKAGTSGGDGSTGTGAGQGNGISGGPM